MIQDSPLVNLKLIPRFSDIYMHDRESVSDHVWGLVSMALVVVPYLNEGVEHPLDLKDVIYRCCVHDLDESGCIDVPRPFKYFNMDLKAKIDEVSIDILRARNVSEDIIKDIKFAKDPSNPNGCIVKILDTIQPGLIMINEIQLGNSLIKKELKNIDDGVNYYLELITYEEIRFDDKIRQRLHDFLIEYRNLVEKYQ